MEQPPGVRQPSTFKVARQVLAMVPAPTTTAAPKAFKPNSKKKRTEERASKNIISIFSSAILNTEFYL